MKITKITQSGKNNQHTTTVPIDIIRLLNLSKGDLFVWEIKNEEIQIKIKRL
jgi:hypothetical protein